MSEMQSSGLGASPISGLFCGARPTILIADEPAAIPRIEALLEGVAALVTASSMPQALAYLRAGVDAALVGLHFEDFHAIDLVRSARSETLNHTTPFICYDALDAGEARRVEASTACEALGARFVSLCTLRREYGIEQGNALFIEAVRNWTSGAEASR